MIIITNVNPYITETNNNLLINLIEKNNSITCKKILENIIIGTLKSFQLLLEENIFEKEIIDDIIDEINKNIDLQIILNKINYFLNIYQLDNFAEIIIKNS